jgi:hypothetical protein
MKYVIALFLFLTSLSVFAGGFTDAAVPTRIDLVQAGSAGFMVYGHFRNVSSCSVSNQFYVEIGHPQYNQIYSTVLAAFMAGKKIWIYSHACKPVPWYTVDTVTYNTMEPSGSIQIIN